MDKDELLSMGLDEEAADRIIADIEKTAESYEIRIDEIKRDFEVDKIIYKSGAKNVKAVKALIQGKDPDSVAAEIEKLKTDEDTKFLFEKRGSFQPARSGEQLPEYKSSHFEKMLGDARRSGNTLAAIRIKQMAAKEGILLM